MEGKLLIVVIVFIAYASSESLEHLHRERARSSLRQIKSILDSHPQIVDSLRPKFKNIGSVTAEDIQIHEWCKEAVCNHTTICDGVGICATVCERGTVQIDPWQEFALKTQRTFNLQQPVNYIQLPGLNLRKIYI